MPQTIALIGAMPPEISLLQESLQNLRSEHMADGVAEGGNVHIVMRGLRADYHVAHFQPAAQAACAAGIDDEIGAVLLQHQGGTERGVHFADAA